MKKNITMLSLLGGFAILFAGAIILSSCEGPAGPQGPPGADGQDGIDGVDGTDGTDGVAGNAVCLECHNLATKAAITAQYETSGHGLGVAASGHAGNDCGECHSTEGFIETQWTGQDTTAAPIPFPTPIGCKACHDFHESLDFENEMNHAIRATHPVDLLAADVIVDFDNAESNLCVNCHQARRAAPDDADPTALVTTNSHWGAHHGPQASVLNGVGGYEFGVSLGTTGTHLSGADCVACHMEPDPTDNTVGGHTWVPNEEVCVSCHGDVPATTTIETKLADLEADLIAAGMLVEEVDGSISIVTASYQADSAGALWNYLLIEEDRSMGVHNPAYANALLTNSIDALAAPSR
jgi:hypothetical protein